MSSSDTPALVRTTGLDPAASHDGRDGDQRAAVGSSERDLADAETALADAETARADAEARLRDRERDLAAAREHLAALAGELERTRDWAEFLGEELAERDERIAALEAAVDREVERREMVVSRYEELLSTSERETGGGLFARLVSVF